MKIFLILLTGLLTSISSLHAQTPEDSVKKVINQLFEAMRNADPVKLKATFADNAILQTTRRNQDGSFFIAEEKIDAFAESIGKLKKDSADERITFETIKIDGPLASVWTPYHFYYAGKFSHCGVNSFQVIRVYGDWKIQYLVDTRRRQGCNPE
jgi:hypothetical protein